MGSSYHQFCPVAKAMELLDERWTMLIVRELVTGSQHFNELRRGVPRMSPTLLSRRLHQLTRAGIVDRHDNSGDVQRATIPWTDFNQANIKVSAQLNVFGPGAHIVDDRNTITGDLGTAAVGIKSYDYIDDRGNPQHVDNAGDFAGIVEHLFLKLRRGFVGVAAHV